MQVGTTLPTGGLYGHRGAEAGSQWQGLALQLDLQFQVPAGHGQSKCAGAGAVTSRPDAGRFYLPDYLGTALLLWCDTVPGYNRSLNGGGRQASRHPHRPNCFTLVPLFHTSPFHHSLPESRLSLSLSSALTGEFCFCGFTYASAAHALALALALAPRPHTHIPAKLDSYSASAQEAVIYGPYL